MLLLCHDSISYKCRKIEDDRYGGSLALCDGEVFQKYQGQFHKITYPWTITESTTEEQFGTEEIPESEIFESLNNVRPRFLAPSKCQGGYDAEGNCIDAEETFS